MASEGVRFIRPEVFALLPVWKLIRDVLDEKVKDGRTLYLPMPNADDISIENSDRYNAYITRAVFYNVTGRTVNGLVGQVFTNKPEVKLPELLKHLEKDCDGQGVGLVQHSQATVSETAAIGHGGLLTDYPQTTDVVTREQVLRGDIKPTIARYNAENIINWDFIKRGSRKVLSLVVLAETYKVPSDDGFSYEERMQWRVLRLDADGLYTVQIYKEEEQFQANGSAFNPRKFEERAGEVIEPKDASGNRLDEIPFKFFGSRNNEPTPDSPPMKTMAEVNIAHYRNSADYEESVFTVGQPTYVVAGLSQQWYDEVLKGKLLVGSRSGIPLPANASAEILQVQPNTMAKEAMDQKESQMRAIGAKLVEDKRVQETATAASIDNASELSFLATVANNVTEAYLESLRFACLFSGAQFKDDMFALNTDFAVNRMSSEERGKLVEEWIKGAITFSEMRRGLRDSGIATLDDEAARAELEKDQAKKDEQAAKAAEQLAKATAVAKPNPAQTFNA